MNRSQKIAAAVVSGAVVVGLVALAAPAVTSAFGTEAPPTLAQVDLASVPTDAQQLAEPVAAASDGEPTAAVPGECPKKAWIYPDDVKPYDSGAVYGATGTATYDAEGTPVSYTVAANDHPVAIGERFCIDYASLGRYDDGYTGEIHPGDILALRD